MTALASDRTMLPSGAELRTQPAHWSRADWLEYRRSGIGASDVAGILGWSPWASPMSVWLDKVGLIDADGDETEHMLLGQLLEPVLCDLLARERGCAVIARGSLVRDIALPWRMCTLDGLASDSGVLAVVECKVTSDWQWDEVPDLYLAQVQWQLGLTGLPVALMPVLHAGRRFHVHEVEADAEAFEALCRVVDRFWHEYVVARKPPPADDHEATTEALKDAYRDRADGTAVELDDATAALACEWLAAKDAVKDARARLDRIENQLRAALGTHTIGTHNGVELITWKPQRGGGIAWDLDALRADHPDLLDRYRREQGVTRVLRAAKALKRMTEG